MIKESKPKTRKTLYNRIKEGVEPLLQANEVELVYSRQRNDLGQISQPKDAAEIFWKFMWNRIETYEMMYLMTLTRRNKVLGISYLGKGSKTGTVCDIQRALGIAILQGASSIIICHNHPSGETRPSDADLKLTKKLKQAVELLDMQLHDHFILTASHVGDVYSYKYYSFAEEGLI